MYSNHSNQVLKVENLGKCYRIFKHPRDRLLQSLWKRNHPLYREFWALQNVSFELPRGCTMGIVGRNGSGKSTLLQLICGTLEPTTGTIERSGRIGALLELGSGFNPEFTGLENVFLNGALLGLKQEEIENKLDAILAFADIGTFIDQPVKTYSSGMAMRLAFAVQAHTDPELLVVDEALAVGDELFQRRCYAHLEKLKQHGTSILLVTHSCPQIVMHCDHALWLHSGQPRLQGDPRQVTVAYQRFSSDPNKALGNISDFAAEEQLDNENQDPSLKPLTTEVYPDQGVRIEVMTLLNQRNNKINILEGNQDIFLELHCYSETETPGLRVGFSIHRHDGLQITGQNIQIDDPEMLSAGSAWRVRFSIKNSFWSGTYLISAGIRPEGAGKSFLHRIVDGLAFRVIGSGNEMCIGACNLTKTPAEIKIISKQV